MAVITDPIADLLTRIRNANMARLDSTEVIYSRMALEIVKILHSEGFIKNYDVMKDQTKPRIKVNIKYGPREEKVITGLKRISKPGRRIYAKRGEIPRVLGGLGIGIITTSKGIMTDREARRQGIGGEILCYVW